MPLRRAVRLLRCARHAVDLEPHEFANDVGDLLSVLRFELPAERARERLQHCRS